jgi:hypothetical protein
VPVCVGSVLVGQCSSNVQALLEGIARFLELALRHQAVRYSEPHLPWKKNAKRRSPRFFLVSLHPTRKTDCRVASRRETTPHPVGADSIIRRTHVTIVVIDCIGRTIVAAREGRPISSDQSGT